MNAGKEQDKGKLSLMRKANGLQGLMDEQPAIVLFVYMA